MSIHWYIFLFVYPWVHIYMRCIFISIYFYEMYIYVCIFLWGGIILTMIYWNCENLWKISMIIKGFFPLPLPFEPVDWYVHIYICSFIPCIPASCSSPRSLFIPPSFPPLPCPRYICPSPFMRLVGNSGSRIYRGISLLFRAGAPSPTISHPSPLFSLPFPHYLFLHPDTLYHSHIFLFQTHLHLVYQGINIFVLISNL